MTFNERLSEERQRQVDLGFDNNFDDTNSISEWITYIVRTASRNYVNLPNNQTDIEKFKTDLIKVAALTQSAYEAIERKQKDTN